MAKAYTLETGAKALDISHRVVAYYEQGDRAIPRIVALTGPGSRPAQPRRGWGPESSLPPTRNSDEAYFGAEKPFFRGVICAATTMPIRT